MQPVVQGIQSQGVIANAKHYIQNNQEGLGPDKLGSRHSTSEVVDERTQMEMCKGGWAAEGGRKGGREGWRIW